MKTDNNDKNINDNTTTQYSLQTTNDKNQHFTIVQHIFITYTFQTFLRDKDNPPLT